MKRDDQFVDMLYQNYYKKLRSYCFAFVSGKTQYADDIEECIQNVFFLAYSKRSKLENCDYLETWLKNACMRRMKKVLSKTCGKRQKAQICSIETLSADSIYLSSNPAERWEEQDEAHVQLQTILNELTVEEKKIVVMYWGDNASLKEVADYLNTSVGTAKNKLHRLKVKIKGIILKKLS